MSTWCYLGEAGLAINLDRVNSVEFIDGTAHVIMADDVAHSTDARADVAALIEALGRLTNQRSADAMRARVKPQAEAVAP